MRASTAALVGLPLPRFSLNGKTGGWGHVLELNGWQRLFVVAAVVWTVAVGAESWRSRPVATVPYEPWKIDFPAVAESRGQSLAAVIRSTAPWAYSDLTDQALESAFLARYPRGSQPAPVSYWEALATEFGAVDAFTEQASDTGPLEPTVDREVPGVGIVRFAASMPKEEVERRSTELAERYAERADARDRADRRRRIEAANRSAMTWLGPIGLVYAAGWSYSWIRRGFQRR